MSIISINQSLGNKGGFISNTPFFHSSQSKLFCTGGFNLSSLIYKLLDLLVYTAMLCCVTSNSNNKENNYNNVL